MEIVGGSFAISGDQVLMIFLTAVIGLVHILFTRSISQLDKRMEKYDERLSKHDAQIAEINSDIKALQQTMNINLINIAKQLDLIQQKIHDYDENIKKFYETYDLVKR
jgi:uncharacterized coiled-coil protein SlyX